LNFSSFDVFIDFIYHKQMDSLLVLYRSIKKCGKQFIINNGLLFIKSYGTGLVGSLFFVAIHGTMQSQIIKDFLAILQLIYCGFMFVPFVGVNLLNIDNMKVITNGFFAGTITPIILGWLISRKKLLI
jgi:hypothetical protein